MISMPYDPRCETIRFAWRNVPFVFAGFVPGRRRKRNEGGRPHASRSDAQDRVSKDGLQSLKASVALQPLEHSLRQAQSRLSRPLRAASERGPWNESEKSEKVARKCS